MNRPKVVKAEVYAFGKFVRAERQFDAYAKTGQVMHDAVVDHLIENEYFPGMTYHRPLRASALH